MKLEETKIGIGSLESVSSSSSSPVSSRIRVAFLGASGVGKTGDDETRDGCPSYYDFWGV